MNHRLTDAIFLKPMNATRPVLYSFRRCPYAMRARLAIAHAGIAVEHREVLLRDKPQPLLAISPKATVPVVLLTDGTVLEESLDIMHWALSHNDPENWLNNENEAEQSLKQLIQQNDSEFKFYLDRYKYADRYPENTQRYYRQKAAVFLQMLEHRLSQQAFLSGHRRCLADMAIFPFVRQFAFVDIEWFRNADFQHLNRWLNRLIESPLFIQIMQKQPVWMG